MRTRVSNSANLEERLRHHGWTVTEYGCWEFNSSKNRDGYGRLSIGRGKQESPHRVAFKVWVGELSADQEVLHSCDNPPCINPEHLKADSHAANMHDMAVKGRTGLTRGEKSGRAILTSEQVIYMRYLRSKGFYLKDIANQFQIAEITVGAICRGTRWGWLEQPSPVDIEGSAMYAHFRDKMPVTAEAFALTRGDTLYVHDDEWV